MRWNPKRLLWLLPTVLITTLVSFWLVGGSDPGQEGPAQGSTAQAVPPLPTFFNPHPKSAERTAWEAALGVAEGNARAAIDLLNLGGAALPHVLPRLDQLDPAQRERVAVALLPLARRFGVLPLGFTPENGRAVTFWLSFWEEYFVNFRELSVRRAVTRYLDSPTAAHQRDLVVLDTFALGELMHQLSPRARKQLSAEQQTSRIRLIDAHLTHVTQFALKQASFSTLSDADRVAQQWLSWWNGNRYQFTSPHGVERFLAPLLQTRYAAWARETASRGTSFGLAPHTELSLLGSAWLLLSGWLGCVLGALSSSFFGKHFPHRRRFLLALPYLMAPLALVLFMNTSAPKSWALAGAALFAFGALLSFRQQSEWQLDGVPSVNPGFPTPISNAFREALAANLVPTTGALLSAVICVESLFKLNGIGAPLLDSIRERNVTWVVGFAVGTSIGLGLLQLLSDRLLRGREAMFASESLL